jgi:hypothetical protein
MVRPLLQFLYAPGLFYHPAASCRKRQSKTVLYPSRRVGKERRKKGKKESGRGSSGKEE